MNARYMTLGMTALLLFLAFRFFLPLVLPFVLAYFFAKCLSPVLNFLDHKLNWNHKFTSIVTVVVTLGFFGGFLFFVGSTLIEQTILLFQRIPVYIQMIREVLENICGRCDRLLELTRGTSYRYMEVQIAKLYENLGGKLIPSLSNCAIGILSELVKWGSGIFIFFLSTLLILLDDTFPSLHKKLRPFANRLKKAGFAYMKAQCMILFLIAVVISCGLYFIGNEYALLLGIGIAVLDAFPIMGSGVVLLPWAVIQLIGGDFYRAAVLVTLFAVCTFLREILEPRIFGKELGMKSLYILISIYVGIKLFGFMGILLGPISITILKVTNDIAKQRETM